MYDTLLVSVKCPECKILKMRNVQTKDFECVLDSFSVGDVVNDSIEKGEIVGTTICNFCNILIDVKCKIKESILTDEYEILSFEKSNIGR